MSEAAAVIEPVVEPVVEVTALEGAADVVATEPVFDAANDNWLPEKHIVKKEDGTLDLEASARKQADAYKSLEKRLGAGDIPPKTAEEYAPEISVEGFDFEAVKSDELYKDFATKAHGLGYTNAQFSFALNEYLTRESLIAQTDAAQTVDACTAQLKEMWPTDNEFKVQTGNALRVVNAYASSPEEAKGIIKAIGNNAVAIKLLAAIGPELQEGKPPTGATVGMVDIEALQKSEAYWSESHPEHAATKARVARYYEEKYPKQK